MRITLLLTLTVLLFHCQPETKHDQYSKTWTESDRQFLLQGLDSTLNLIMEEAGPLNDEQWNWKPDSTTWSIALVVEHLEVHDELFHREVRVLSSLPGLPGMPDSLFGSDKSILSYGEVTPQNTGISPEYLQPLGRWCSKQDAITAYKKVRKSLMEFVKYTDSDLRRYYTTSGRGSTRFRDLHQLLLISIAHTSRHHKQILKIKNLPCYPEQ